MRHLKKTAALLILSLGLLGTAVAAAKAPTTHHSAHNQPDFIVTLLGTGMPVPSIKRFGAATLVQAGDVSLLFDAGRGVLMRLWQMGLSSDSLDAVFLTHLHSDHTVGLPDLFLSGWVMDSIQGKAKHIHPFVIYGPGPIPHRPGTKHMMHYIKKAYAADIWIREHDAKLPAEGVKIEAHNIPAKTMGVIYKNDGVKVTVFPVDHGKWAKPAFGYRVDYDGRSVTLSGDTVHQGPGTPLARMAKGTDVFIHEVFAAGPKFLHSKAGMAVKNHHTLPRQAGLEFSHANPRLAVYSHIVLVGESKSAKPTPKDVIRETRETYSGPLLVGKDLTSIVIGKHKITVRQPVLGLLPVAPPHKTGRYP